MAKKIPFLIFSFFYCFSLFSEVTLETAGIQNFQKYEKIAENHYAVGVQAMNSKDWKKAADAFHSISRNFPRTKYGPIANYFCGVSLFNAKEYETANKYFTNYLKEEEIPQFFEETLKYKFSIAEYFRGGEKRRPFGKSTVLKILPAYQVALSIYDEISNSIPSHDLAALSLYYQGCLLWKLREFRDAIDSFQLLAKRFPKHEFTPDAYLYINKVYYDQACREFQNPDLISLAEVNVKKFQLEFPKDCRIEEAAFEVEKIKEVYAKGLFDTGQFYERTYKPKASLIYYETAILQYPYTQMAQECKKRLAYLSPNLLEGINKLLDADIECAKLENAENIEQIDFETIDFGE